METPTIKQAHGFGTLAVHAGQPPDPATGAIMTPIYQTSTYVQQAPNENQGYEYARVSNPTRTALEKNLAALENATHGLCFASGMAAIDAIVKGLRPGNHVVASDDLYGGTHRLLKQVYGPFGLHASFVDMTDLDAVAAALRPETKLVWIETPTNPLLRIVDVAAVCALARERGIDTVVDNTFATPFLQRPLDLGADLVMHSTTKYLGGHSDVVGGFIGTNRDDWNEHLRFQIKSVGAVPGPMDCFLTLRGTKTLHLRMERHCASAHRLAEFLEAHPKVGDVRYPGLPGHPGHEIAARQMRAFGGMITFGLAEDDFEAALRVLTGTEVFALAESLGGVESLIEHPASMTHASIPREERLAAGLHDTLIRLSVGIEDFDDLRDDLDRALARA